MKYLVAFFALCLSGFALASPLNTIVVFGDSLSDNGNLYEYMQHKIPQSPPYYEGRFSDGPIWAERLAESFFPNEGKDHLLDYAFGGAGISEDADDDDVLFTLKREIDAYLLAHQNKADPDTLFVIWIGANNYLGLPDDNEAALKEVNAGIVHSLQRLAMTGAKHVMVVNLPDLGKTPAAINFDAREQLTYLSKEHNERLFNSVDELRESYPEVQWVHFDVSRILNSILDNPEHYGFNNIKETCYDVLVDESPKKSILHMVSLIKPKAKVEACEGYLFFDPVHPTAAAHQIIADTAKLVFDSVGIQFGVEVLS